MLIHPAQSDLRRQPAAYDASPRERELGAFTQSLDDTRLDASVLMLPLVGFIEPEDPRMRSTLERIRERLMVDGLVYRYRDPIDGLRGGEGAFSICTFWFIDGLTLSGQLDEAHRLFERMLGYSTDLGLYSEEIDPATGELLGNFPQAFTHIALINAALNLTKAQQRGHRRLQGDQAERAASVQGA